MKPDSPTPTTIDQGRRLMVLLIVMASLGPLSINILLPAVPGLAASLQADSETVQLTISLYFAGLATAQLALGALSDRFGRRPVLLVGFLITVVTSLAAATATSVTLLVTARTTQAFGASTGIVIGRAIVRDIYARDRAASMLGWVTMSTVAIPMFGPLLGGLLYEHFGWRSIFLFIGAAAAVIVIWAAKSLPETRPPQAAAGASLKQLGKESRALLSTPAFIGYVVCAAMISGPYYAILGGAPHIVITQMGRSTTELGVWFLLSSFGYMIGNFCAGRFSVRFGVNAMVAWGMIVEVAGGALAVALALLVPEAGPIIVFAPACIIYIGNGIALPNAIAGAVSVRPQSAGTASGVAGFGQMGYGALMSQFISVPLEGSTSAMPLAWAMVLQGFVGLALFRLLVQPRRAVEAI